MNPFLALSLSLSVVWLLMFLFAKSTRREMLLMSFIGLLLAPAILTIVAADFRAFTTAPAPVQVEGLLFVFTFFGIASGIFEALLGKHKEQYRAQREKDTPSPLHWILKLIIIFGIWAFIGFSLMFVFHVPSIHGFLVGGLLIGTYIIADRKDLLLDALLSGALMATLIFLMEQFLFFYVFPNNFELFWNPGVLAGLTVGVIPLEEIMWAAIAGFTLGPLYEYVRDLTISNTQNA